MSSPVLLDTCTTLWIMNGGTMKQDALLAMDGALNAGQPAFVSPITGWEIGMLASKGRFRSPYAPRKWLEKLLALPHIALAEMPPELLMESNFLPGIPPRDPWDRVIVATAREFGLVLITRDHEMLDYAADGHVGALEC